MRTYRTIESRCPVCRTELSAATSTEDVPTRGPWPGDFSLCFDCGAMLRYDDLSRPRLATVDDQLEILMAQPDDFWRMKRLHLAIQRRIKREKA